MVLTEVGRQRVPLLEAPFPSLDCVSGDRQPSASIHALTHSSMILGHGCGVTSHVKCLSP